MVLTAEVVYLAWDGTPPGGSVRLKRLMRRMCGSVRLKRLMRHKGRIGRFFVGFLVLEH